MNLQLDQTDQNRLEAIAKREGVAAEDLAKEILHTGLLARESVDGSSDEQTKLAAEQHAAMEKLLEELDTLPEGEPKDGICASVDHDKILYGGPAPGQKGGFPERRSPP